ncbi:MAG: protoporphyrinogen oxidase [Melioribacteraceae bacterium]
MNKKVIVIGAGISGLATAYWINKSGYDVKVLETNSQAGGAMQSNRENDYLLDLGPNSGLETTPLIGQLVKETGISDEMIYANDAGNKRYILRNDDLHELPTKPIPFIQTKLFSLKGKLRIFGEPFVGKSEDGYYQSISQFVSRRLGQEFLDYAINPFVSGVFAGDPDKLSVKSAFPKLYRLEELYGGLVKGMFKGARERKKNAEKSKQTAKMFSFKNGMQTLPNAIAASLGEKVIFNISGIKISKNNNKYKIDYSVNGENISEDCDSVLSTVPAYIVSKYFSSFDDNLENRLEDVYHPPVMILYLGYKKEQIKRKLDGFGYLIPTKEKKNYLGAIWSSVIFQNRAPEGDEAFTIFIGGAQAPHLFASPKEELIKDVISEFSQLMKIEGEPKFIRHKFWEKAIPQYNLGYIEIEKYCDQFEENNPGLFISGNFRGGISVGDCVKNSELVYKKINNYLEV